MPTTTFAKIPPGQISEREGPLVERAMARYGIIERQASSDERARERENVIYTIARFDAKLQEKDFNGLYLDIENSSNASAGVEVVRIEYATRLFNSALGESYYPTAVRAYDLIMRIAEVVTPNDVPEDVFRRGDALARVVAFAGAECLQVAAEGNSMAALRLFGLLTNERLSALVPHLRNVRRE